MVDYWKKSGIAGENFRIFILNWSEDLYRNHIAGGGFFVAPTQNVNL